MPLKIETKKNERPMNPVVTIDGPAGSGKSTVSRAVATTLHFLYLDTGAMYRAVALQATREGIDFRDGKKLWELCKNLDLQFQQHGTGSKLFIGEEDISNLIRTPEMDLLSSKISAMKEVREAMTELQRKIGRKGPLVAEGRDMGTVVFPDAPCKFFITASAEIRAERRYRERKDRGESVSKADVARELKKRDEQDTTRAIAPLRPAPDARIIDTTTLNAAQVAEEIIKAIRERMIRSLWGKKDL